MQLDPYVALGNAQDRRHLAGVQVLEVERDECLFDGWQPADALVEASNVILQGLIRIERMDGTCWGIPGRSLLHQAVSSLRRAKVVEAAVDRDAVDPSAELRPILETGQTPPDA